MIVLVNGAFGVGKTTVARLVAARLPGAIVFDPEIVGLVLRRLPRFVPLRGRGTDDFQDLPAWRALTVRCGRALRRLRPTLVVPMSFSRLDYLDEVRRGLAAADPDLHHFCLTAPLGAIHERLRRRGTRDEGATRWAYRRAAECVEAHRDPAWAVHVGTDGRTPAEVADEIVTRLEGRREGRAGRSEAAR